MATLLSIKKTIGEKNERTNDESVEVEHPGGDASRIDAPEAGADVEPAIEELEQFLTDHSATVLSLSYCGRAWLSLIPEIAAETENSMSRYRRGESVDGLTALTAGGVKDAVVSAPVRLWRCPMVMDVSGARMDESHADDFASSIVPLLSFATVIDLSDNRIGPSGWAAVAEAVATHCRSLEHLHVSENIVRDAGARTAALLLQHLPHLQSLSLGTCQLTPKAGPVLAAGLLNTSSLTNLALEYNALGDDGVSEIAAALPRCPQLTVLNLSDNAVGDRGAAALADSLTTAGVAKLNLAVNAIWAPGARSLAALLQRRSSLVDIDLACNKFGPEGVIALAAAIATAPVLEVIDLTSSSFNPAAGAAIADALDRNGEVDIVWFNNPDVGRYAGNRIVDLLAARNTSTQKRAVDCVDEVAGSVVPTHGCDAHTVGPAAKTGLSFFTLAVCVVGVVSVAGAFFMRRR